MFWDRAVLWLHLQAIAPSALTQALEFCPSGLADSVLEVEDVFSASVPRETWRQ